MVPPHQQKEMISGVPTLRASSDALLFICFLFFMAGCVQQQRGPAGRYKRQVIRYKRQAGTLVPRSDAQLVACQGFFRARLYLTWMKIYGTILI